MEKIIHTVQPCIIRRQSVTIKFLIKATWTPLSHMGWDSLLVNKAKYLRDLEDFCWQKSIEALGEQHGAFNKYIMKWSSDLLLLKEFLSTSNDLLLPLIKLVSNEVGPQKNTAFDNSLMHIRSQTQTHFINKKREREKKTQSKAPGKNPRRKRKKEA